MNLFNPSLVNQLLEVFPTQRPAEPFPEHLQIDSLDLIQAFRTLRWPEIGAELLGDDSLAFHHLPKPWARYFLPAYLRAVLSEDCHRQELLLDFVSFAFSPEFGALEVADGTTSSVWAGSPEYSEAQRRVLYRTWRFLSENLWDLDDVYQPDNRNEIETDLFWNGVGDELGEPKFAAGGAARAEYEEICRAVESAFKARPHPGMEAVLADGSYGNEAATFASRTWQGVREEIVGICQGDHCILSPQNLAYYLPGLLLGACDQDLRFADDDESRFPFGLRNTDNLEILIKNLDPNFYPKSIDPVTFSFRERSALGRLISFAERNFARVGIVLQIPSLVRRIYIEEAWGAAWGNSPPSEGDA